MADANQASTIKVSGRPLNAPTVKSSASNGRRLKRRLLEGLDPVGMTLEHEGDSAFENDDRGDRPWAHAAFDRGIGGPVQASRIRVASGPRWMPLPSLDGVRPAAFAQLLPRLDRHGAGLTANAGVAETLQRMPRRSCS